MSSGRHAYLIAAHGGFLQLKTLLTLLDDPRNDLYVHMDKKAKGFCPQDFSAVLKNARITFVPRLNCRWGSARFIDAILSLLSAAVKTEHAYYHLISGADLPLKTQDEIHAYFDAHAGEEFVEYDDPCDMPRHLSERLRYYFLLPAGAGRLFPGAARLDALQLRAQHALHIDRLKHSGVCFQKGAVWFSITGALAHYALDTAPAYQKYYRLSRCADELWLQTLVFASPFYERLHSASYGDCSANQVYVDWARGNGNSPYTFTLADYDLLIARPELFARKFDAARDSALFEKMIARLCAHA